MTDQPKPDRQDGDGLLRELLVFVSSQRQSDIDPEVRDAICNKIIALPDYATPQPARDAAEVAALDRENHWRKLEGRNPAPQKPAPSAPGHTDLMVTPESIDAFMEKNQLPAPDAMREAMRVISTMAVCEVGEAAENLQQIVEACRDVAREALSAPVPPADCNACYGDDPKYTECRACGGNAPVPPADGARQTPAFAQIANQIGDEDPPTKWLVSALRHLARDLLADLKTPWIGDRDPKKHICWVAADRLPPSGTGAAEPDEWQRKGLLGKWITLQDATPERLEEWREQGHELRPLYAAPPVRGDRETLEAFARQLEQRANGYEARGTSIFNGHIIADELNEQAARLRALSLPVQPGAGEREAIIRECAEKVQSYLGATTESKRFGDEAYAMLAAFSRQAPPSSSEGGQ